MARTLTRGNRNRDTSYAKPADEETPAPAAGRRRRTSSAPAEEDKPKARGTGTVTKGWGAYTKTAEETKRGGFAAEYKPKDNETGLIKILDDGPFAVYKQHWIERGKGKKKSFNCLKDDEGNGPCPLCDDLGDNPRAQAMVNVVDMLEDPEDQEVLVWKIGPMIGDILANAAKEKRTSPINKEGLYWSVEKIVKSNKTTYQIVPVKEDAEFAEDWDTDPLTQEDFDAFVAEGYDDSEVHFETVAELQEIADEIEK